MSRREITARKKAKSKKIRIAIIAVLAIITVVYGIYSSEEDIRDRFANLFDWASSNVRGETTTDTGGVLGIVDVELDPSLLNIFFFDVGQGDSTLIISAGKTMLIDAGNDWDGAVVAMYLNSFGVTRIDYLIASHAHADHIGGMDTIINSFEIGTIHIPLTDHPTVQVQEFLTAMLENDLQYELVEIGDVIHLGNASLEVVSVDNTNPSNLNNTSIVLRMTYENQTFLFMADAESDIEDAIKWEPVNILRTGHHGSHTSSTERFLRQTMPEVSIISVGMENRYGHPRQEVLERLDNIGSRIYRTDENGTIWLTSDGTRNTINFLRRGR